MVSRTHIRALRFSALAAGIASPSPAQAQTANVQMSADRTDVAVGDVFTLQISIEVDGGQADAETLPSLDAFRVVGRQVSRPIRFSFGFGSQTQMVHASTVHVFNLQALNPGTFRIDAPKVRVGGRVFSGAPLTIRVGGSGASNLTGDPLPAEPPKQDLPTSTPGTEYDPDLFLRTVIDKTNPYVGEQVTVTVYLYDRGVLNEAPTPTREPTTDGFWIQDLLPPTRQRDSTVDVVNGTRFRVYVLRRFAAFPLREGTLTIGPMAIESATSPFDRFFGGSGAPLERASNPVSMQVKPLPAGSHAPVVLVGRFALEAKVDAPSIHTGNAGIFSVIAYGNGTLHELRLELPPTPGLRIHPPTVKDEVTMPGDLVSGTRTFEWMVIPEEPGSYTLPSLTMATFDPTTGQHRTLRTDPISLTVTGPSTALLADPGAASAQPAPLPGEENAFRPIRTHAALSHPSDSIVHRPLYSWLLSLPPAGALALWITRRVRRRIERRREGQASAVAVRRARKRLAVAETLCRDQEPALFYAEIARVLQAVLDARIGAASAGMTRPQIRDALRGRGAPEDLVEALVHELERCDFARFSSSGSSAEEMRQSLDRAGRLFDRLDRLALGEQGATP